MFWIILEGFGNVLDDFDRFWSCPELDNADHGTHCTLELDIKYF